MVKRDATGEPVSRARFLPCATNAVSDREELLSWDLVTYLVFSVQKSETQTFVGAFPFYNPSGGAPKPKSPRAIDAIDAL